MCVLCQVLCQGQSSCSHIRRDIDHSSSAPSSGWTLVLEVTGLPPCPARLAQLQWQLSSTRGGVSTGACTGVILEACRPNPGPGPTDSALTCASSPSRSRHLSLDRHPEHHFPFPPTASSPFLINPYPAPSEKTNSTPKNPTEWALGLLNKIHILQVVYKALGHIFSLFSSHRTAAFKMQQDPTAHFCV